jgi:hypothetical protein
MPAWHTPLPSDGKVEISAPAAARIYALLPCSADLQPRQIDNPGFSNTPFLGFIREVCSWHSRLQRTQEPPEKNGGACNHVSCSHHKSCITPTGLCPYGQGRLANGAGPVIPRCVPHVGRPTWGPHRGPSTLSPGKRPRRTLERRYRAASAQARRQGAQFDARAAQVLTHGQRSAQSLGGSNGSGELKAVLTNNAIPQRFALTLPRSRAYQVPTSRINPKKANMAQVPASGGRGKFFNYPLASVESCRCRAGRARAACSSAT